MEMAMWYSEYKFFSFRFPQNKYLFSRSSFSVLEWFCIRNFYVSRIFSRADKAQHSFFYNQNLEPL